MTCRAALCTTASLCARRAIPARAAAGASDASSTVRDPYLAIGRGASASSRNGAASTRASSREPQRPSRYKTISCAPRPATVSQRKSVSDSTLAADTATAAAAGRRKASGSVVSRQSRQSTRAD